MVFSIHTTLSNSYRCSCCYDASTRAEVVATKEEALARLPKEFPKDQGYINEDLGKLFEVKKVVVYDESGAIFGFCELDWPTEGPRGCGYKYYRWYGEIEGEKFEKIYGDNIEGKTWDEVCKLLTESSRDAKINSIKGIIEGQVKILKDSYGINTKLEYDR